ncbi:MAG: type IV secretion system DNA-binding domain-containing protein [Terriglobia bacterium]|nr:type IV secretion system DNA-binding domain-containing protein [Terriglobia bacterium]
MKPLFFGFDVKGEKILLSPEERCAHMHVIGSSGSGKSKFLEWLMRQDLDKRQGFCLIDPHGDLYEEVLHYAAHKVLRRDTILLNLSNASSIIGFNPFERTLGVEISAQVDRRIAATLRAWNVKTTDETPTLERTLRLVYTIMIEQNLGLREVNHLITYQAREVRAQLIERLQSPLIQTEWEELQKLSRRDWQEEVLSAKNRLFRLLTSGTLSRFLGMPGQSIDLGDIIENDKVLLVNLAASDSLSSENARVFGALLVNEFFEAAKRRKKDSLGRDPKPYYLYIDEFQNFVTLDVGDMLDQVRKRGLFVILAHQRFGQLDENVTDAALANCHIKAVFGGLPVASARRMAEELFIGKLDPKRVKAAIYQTKFWPQYGRDTVYGSGSSRAASHGSGCHSASGSSSSFGSGEFFGPEDWFGGSSTSSQSGESWMTGSIDMETDSSSESESTADIPVFTPVPFEELSSIQYYTPEEQLLEFTAALKQQFPRHCFIKVHQRDTQPMLVPKVTRFYTRARNRSWYVEKLFRTQHALPAAEVDRLIEERERKLLAGLKRDDLPEDFRE